MEITTILWREWLFLKRRFWRITFSQMVSPLLYFVTFGIGLGRMIDSGGQPYLHYLIPGLLSMTTMRNSYTSVSTRISVMRLHEKSFESYFYSPTKIVFWDLHSYSGIRIKGGAFVKRMAAAGRNAQCPDFFRPRIFCGNDYRVALRHE